MWPRYTCDYRRLMSRFDAADHVFDEAVPAAPTATGAAGFA